MLFRSVRAFFERLPLIIFPTYRNIRNCIKESDFVLIRVPSPIGGLVCAEARRQDVPYGVYVAGDIRSVATRGEKYSGITRQIVTCIAEGFHRINKRISRETLTFVTGSELCSVYEPLSYRCIRVIPSVVRSEELHWRTSDTLDNPVELLSVARLVPVKGLEYLLEAVKRLRSEGYDVRLTIVGDGPLRQKLEQRVCCLEIDQYVAFEGHIPFGSELLDRYRSADVFVQPSLSEGVPKTITEAMASSLPVVATDVGGVSDIISHKNTGILIQPQSSKEIATGIKRILDAPDLRERIATNGYELANQHTVEKQATMMVNEMTAFICENRNK